MPSCLASKWPAASATPSPEHYARGWHITSTCGVFGAALAAARALGLNARQNLDALGAAAVQAGGLVEALGTGAKSISVGNAARNGLLSALLAAEGFDGPPLPLEGERGYLRVAGVNPRLTPSPVNSASVGSC